MTRKIPLKAWEDNEDVVMARANLRACAYNAAVNYGSERAAKKMRHLIQAINHEERVVGAAKLTALVEAGVIDGYIDCPRECEMRPGGLYHADGCENDYNHPVSHARRQKAREVLPGGQSGDAGWLAANVHLVGGV